MKWHPDLTEEELRLLLGRDELDTNKDKTQPTDAKLKGIETKISSTARSRPQYEMEGNKLEVTTFIPRSKRKKKRFFFWNK